ncbi:MAG: phosphate acyltransferase PlsX [Janthinobacterium lividum]
MPLKIAVDAMGGDYAPTEVVKGALAVARERADVEIVLVGQEAAINAALETLGDVPVTVTIRAAEQAIEMGEHPVQATRRKRASSLVVSGLMVKHGEADATFSAGSTGAAMAIATLDIGRIPGIERPALATGIPTIQGRALLLDAGANVDCSTRNLRQFALLGAIYAERVTGVSNPKVGLLNIGSEEAKGNELTKEAHQFLKSTSLNFFGNVEGKDVFEHAVDVVVCDGFSGNVLIKSGEGMAEMVFDLLHRLIETEPEVAQSQDMLAALFRRLAQRIHYSEFGGATLLGVNGVSVIGHGRSDAKAISGGIRAAVDAAAGGYVQAIRDALPAFEGKA